MSTAAGHPFPRVEVPYIARTDVAGRSFPRVEPSGRSQYLALEVEAHVAEVARAAMLAEEARLIELVRDLAGLAELDADLIPVLEVIRFTGRVDEALVVVVDVAVENLHRAEDPVDLVVEALARAIEAGRR